MTNQPPNPRGKPPNSGPRQFRSSPRPVDPQVRPPGSGGADFDNRDVENQSTYNLHGPGQGYEPRSGLPSVPRFDDRLLSPRPGASGTPGRGDNGPRSPRPDVPGAPRFNDDSRYYPPRTSGPSAPRFDDRVQSPPAQGPGTVPIDGDNRYYPPRPGGPGAAQLDDNRYYPPRPGVDGRPQRPTIRDVSGIFGLGKLDLRRRRLSLRLAIVVLICSVLLAVCGLTGLAVIPRVQDARAAAADAKMQVAAMEVTLKSGNAVATVLQQSTLTDMQSHLSKLSSDLNRLQSDLVASSLPTGVSRLAALKHGLAMGMDLTRAGQATIDAALIIVPRLSGILSDVSGTQKTTGSTPPANPLTMADINMAQSALNIAGSALQQAVTERSYIHDSDLSALGEASLIPELHKFDALAQNLPKFLQEAQTALTAMPGLLGVSQPSRLLLFEVDSDELRPTGGFLGNYAVLTFASGHLSGGVHLHDINTLDCPSGVCHYNLIPAQFTWFPLGGRTTFAVHDSNLNPDYPSSAKLAEQMFVQEGGPSVDGVISVTPAAVKEMLNITGSITVPAPFGNTVTPANLQDVIHYYHLIANHGLAYGTSGSQYGTSTRKVFDAVFGSLLLQKVAALPQTKRGQLVSQMLKAIGAHDIQVYFNDPHLEGLLSTHSLDGSVHSAQGDSEYVVDTNVGGNYANADVKEYVNDHVTLDSKGTATHNLTISYNYPYVHHLYTSLLGGYWKYVDFVRVVVPSGAHLLGMSGCYPYQTSQSGHSVFACTFTVWETASTVLHFSWTVPHATTAVGNTSQYTLFVERESGTDNAINVTISSPNSQKFVTPVKSPLTAVSASQVRYRGYLGADQSLLAGYSS